MSEPWKGAIELWGRYASPAIDSIGDANEIEVVTKADFVAAVTETRAAALAEGVKVGMEKALAAKVSLRGLRPHKSYLIRRGVTEKEAAIRAEMEDKSDG